MHLTAAGCWGIARQQQQQQQQPAHCVCWTHAPYNPLSHHLCLMPLQEVGLTLHPYQRWGMMSGVALPHPQLLPVPVMPPALMLMLMLLVMVMVTQAGV